MIFTLKGWQLITEELDWELKVAALGYGHTARYGVDIVGLNFLIELAHN